MINSKLTVLLKKALEWRCIMVQIQLKQLLANVIHDIETNKNCTLHDVIHKLTIEMENSLFVHK